MLNCKGRVASSICEHYVEDAGGRGNPPLRGGLEGADDHRLSLRVDVRAIDNRPYVDAGKHEVCPYGLRVHNRYIACAIIYIILRNA